jgi:hypothetical protein
MSTVNNCHKYLLPTEPWMARKFLIVDPACYLISYYPRKRTLRITTSSHGGAGSSTGSGSGTTDSGASSCCRLELAACHVWYCVRCLAPFRSSPPFHFKYIYIWGNSLFVTYYYFYSFFNIFLHIHMFTYVFWFHSSYLFCFCNAILNPPLTSTVVTSDISLAQ